MLKRNNQNIIQDMHRIADLERPWKPNEGMEVITTWKQSGLSQSDFCRKYGLKAHRLSYWSAKQNQRPNAAGNLQIVPCKLETKQTPNTTSPSAAGRQKIKILMPSGIIIELPDNFNESTLKKLLVLRK